MDEALSANLIPLPKRVVSPENADQSGAAAASRPVVPTDEEDFKRFVEGGGVRFEAPPGDLLTVAVSLIFHFLPPSAAAGCPDSGGATNCNRLQIVFAFTLVKGLNMEGSHDIARPRSLCRHDICTK